MNIGIVGGGLNGLACALLLKKFGHQVKVFERANEPANAGTGIYIWPQGVQILKFILGSTDFIKVGAPIDYLLTQDRNANLIHKQSVNMPGHDFPAPAVMFERRKLLNLLKDELGEGVIQYNAKCTDIGNYPTHASIEINNEEVHDVDLIIGCDGISSVVRNAITDNKPYYTGVVASRGIVNFDTPLLKSNSCQIFTHDNARLVSYPLDKATNLRYWFIAYQHELKNECLSKDEMIEHLAGLANPLLEMVKHTAEENIITHPLRAIKPCKPWFHHRCVILGDSAHGMLPTLGYGLTLGLENGFVLGQAINGNCFADIAPALKRFESRVAERSKKMTTVMEELTDLFYFKSKVRQFNDLLDSSMNNFHQLAETTVF